MISISCLLGRPPGGSLWTQNTGASCVTGNTVAAISLPIRPSRYLRFVVNYIPSPHLFFLCVGFQTEDEEEGGGEGGGGGGGWQQ